MKKSAYLRWIAASLLAGWWGVTAEAEFAGGTGLAENPYLVATAEHLDNVRNHLDAHFRQVADIDLGVEPWNQEYGWMPIGISIYNKFNGVYDGNGSTITGLEIINLSEHAHGYSLFGIVGPSGVIRNVRMENGTVEAQGRPGLLASTNEGVIENCRVAGVVVSHNEWSDAGGLVGVNHGTILNSRAVVHVSGFNRTGGLVGANWGAITNSQAHGQVTGNDLKDKTVWNVGGLVGNNSKGASVSRCWASSAVDGFENVGGLVGKNQGLIEYCFASGPVTDRKEYSEYFGFMTGGLVGSNRGLTRYSYATSHVKSDGGAGGLAGENLGEIIACYAAARVEGGEGGGGLVGSNMGDIVDCFSISAVAGEGGGLVLDTWEGTVENSYWNVETSGQVWSDGGEGRTTAEMTYPHADNTYVNWNFIDVWAADAGDDVNQGYPYLKSLIPHISYEDWVGAIPDPELRGAHDAPAGDGIPNLLKYASGLNPMTAYSSADVMTIHGLWDDAGTMAYMLVNPRNAQSSATPFAIVFYRSKTAAGVSLFAEHATDLIGENWGADGVTEERIGEDGDREIWKATAPPDTVGYMRLRVERVD